MLTRLIAWPICWTMFAAVFWVVNWLLRLAFPALGMLTFAQCFVLGIVWPILRFFIRSAFRSKL